MLADALSKRIMLLNTLSVGVVSMECMKELYLDHANFAKS
jgi:hypothetical protein